MQKFICIHTLPANALTRQQVDQFARAAQQDSQIRGYRSFVNLSEGKAVCIIESPDKQTAANWFKKMGLPVDSISKLELEGDRGTVMVAEGATVSAAAQAQ